MLRELVLVYFIASLPFLIIWFLAYNYFKENFEESILSYAMFIIYRKEFTDKKLEIYRVYIILSAILAIVVVVIFLLLP